MMKNAGFGLEIGRKAAFLGLKMGSHRMDSTGGHPGALLPKEAGPDAEGQAHGGGSLLEFQRLGAERFQLLLGP